MAELKMPESLYEQETMGDGRIITHCTMRQQVLHCIGMEDSDSQRHKPYKRHGQMFYKPWRNYFETYADDKTWTALCNAGYAAHGDVSAQGGTVFWITRKGLEWLSTQLGITIMYDRRRDS